jgi:prolyl 4-hydroxylase
MTPLATLRSQGIVWIDGFLGAKVCAQILDELRFAFWWPSTVVNRSRKGDLTSFASQTRQSETTTQEWFTAQLVAELAHIEGRLFQTLRLQASRIEPWQATRYGPGGRFDSHDDAGVFAGEPAGERDTTLVLYVEAPQGGGETAFPQLQLVVPPVPGRLVAWQNLLPDGTVNRKMRHTSRPVSAGTKTTLVTWSRQHDVAQGMKGERR